MSINQITSDLHRALKQQDKLKVETLRYLLAEIKKYQIDHYPPDSKKNITREEIWQIIRKQIKNRQEAIAWFVKGKRPDLADKETKEAAILKGYLP